jgi:hypothetical protein
MENSKHLVYTMPMATMSVNPGTPFTLFICASQIAVLQSFFVRAAFFNVDCNPALMVWKSALNQR